ncbi:MAG: hypothetical protein V1755_06510 [Chloroflexota bacterium]
MSERFKPGTVEGTHIYFDPLPDDPKRRTRRWFVRSKHETDSDGDGLILTDIAWFGRWRKYAAQPRDGTIYEETCLREIAEFCEQRTREHRLRQRNGVTEPGWC